MARDDSVRFDQPTEWHYIEAGKGRPIVLLHGLGATSANWNRLIPPLARHRRVIAFDLPGFGRTPLDGMIGPPAVARGLAAAMRVAKVDPPADLVGSSLGGWVALEAARQGLARTVTAVAPGGLWARGFPLTSAAIFRWYRMTSKLMPSVTARLVRMRAGRALLLWPLSTAARSVSSDEAAEGAVEMGRGDGFEPNLRYIRTHRFRLGAGLEVPVTVVFGERDRILPRRRAQLREELPPDHSWVTLPKCGHLPAWDAPDRLVDIILATTETW